MENTDESLSKLKASLDEAIDKGMSREELDKRWAKYRKLFQKLIREEYLKIDKRYLSPNERAIFKRFKNCILSSNVAFRKVHRMLQFDSEVREEITKYPALDEYINFFEEGYGVTSN